MLKGAMAVIIAGGKSSRMQEDKALLPFGAYLSLAEFQYRRLDKLFSKVYISSKENKFDFEADIIKDVYAVSSPLVALVSIFDTLEGLEEIFVLSVDAPFVDEQVIKKLYEVREATLEINFDVIVAESKYGLEPLCAIYCKSFLEKAKNALKKNEHRLMTLLNALKIKKVFIEEETKFMNLNYPKEYEAAKLIMSKK